jgi:Flagellar filament outer layer protein Flaa
MMMRLNTLIASAALLFVVGIYANAQSTVSSPGATTISVGQPDATKIGTDTAQQKLVEVSVTKFEDPGLWTVAMPLDEGIITDRGLPGAPKARQPIPGEQEAGLSEQDTTVLGVKVIFFRRGFNRFTITPLRPIPVEGVVKTLSMWVVGRNTNHVLNVDIRGIDGRLAELPIGPLNFTGWKQLTVAIPETVTQQDFHYSDRSGIEIEGFSVDTAPLEAYGSYYLYLDDLTAVTDLFGQQQRNVDDMSDAW